MSAAELLRAAMNAAFFVVFAATAWAFVRRPRLDRGIVALLFALPAAAVGLGLLEDALGVELPPPLSALLVMAIPVVTLRAVSELAPVPRVAQWLALAGFAVSAVIAVTLPEDGAQGTGVLALVVYFFAVEAYAAWITVREATGARGVTRARLAAVAAGTFLLGVTLLVVAVPPLAPLVPLGALLSMASYFLGFATPSGLRHAWQAEGLREFLRVAGAAAQLPETDGVLAALARGTAGTLGATTAAAGVRGRDPDTVHIVTADGVAHDAGLDVPVGGRAMRLGHALADVPRPEAVWARGMGTALAAPIVSGADSIGFLSVFAPRRSLFLEEDLSLLQLLADQAAVVLQNRRFYDDLRSAQGELERRLQELNAVNQELAAFAYSVSHDLRAPLRSLDGFSAALLDRYRSELDDTGKRYLGFLRESSVEMGALIDDLLRLSLVTRSEMHREALDLSGLAEEIVTRLRRAEPGRAAKVGIEGDMVAVGDQALVRAALENLLGNAWKFTSKRAVAEIAFGRVEKGRQTFFIRDNGAGFDMRYAGKLFGAFQRLHAKDEFPGTGIGLATVQRVVRRHGGEVWATSEPDRGTTFYFTLEARVERPEHDTDGASREEAVTA
ncbi:MAG: sensor histidine kinase [Candidatus Limnocylindria bacterium]